MSAIDLNSDLGEWDLNESISDAASIDDAAMFAIITSANVAAGFHAGTRRNWFTAELWERMLDHEWHVSPRSDRSGIRLEDSVLDRTERRELPSEGMLSGAIQVSTDGVPTILAVDHPVTGGYPVIAVVTDDFLDPLAQLRPGQEIRFRLATGHS